MYGLLRTASAVVIVLGLNAGAVPSARADVAYDSFGQWFDAFRNGDHHGPRPRYRPLRGACLRGQQQPQLRSDR